MNLWWFQSLSFHFIFLSLPVLLLHDGGFLDSHSTQQRTALAPAAKTPYLCLAACWQDAAVRHCRGQRLQDEMGHGLMDELLSYRKGPSNIRVLKLNNYPHIRSDKWENGMTEGTAAAQGDPIRSLPKWRMQFFNDAAASVSTFCDSLDDLITCAMSVGLGGRSRPPAFCF